jgi:hypothetical protein
MWHTLEVAWNALELLLHWRLNVCVILAIAVALALSWAYPSLPRLTMVGVAILVGGAAGLLWEFTRAWSSPS